MRIFQLHRDEDVTGASGTGVVAEGIEFWDGTVAMRWFGANASTVMWPNVATAMRVHGHDGRTRLVWVANELDETERALAVNHESGPKPPCGLDPSSPFCGFNAETGQCPLGDAPCKREPSTRTMRATTTAASIADYARGGRTNGHASEVPRPPKVDPARPVHLDPFEARSVAARG